MTTSPRPPHAPRALATAPNDNLTGDGVDHHFNSIAPLYFLFLGLLLGALCLYVRKRFIKFPYSAMLFVIGLVFGIANEAAGEHAMYDLSTSINKWVAIDPHLFGAVFLPALIFSDAMRVDVHLFRRVFWQCMLLASVGVLAQFVGNACLARYLLDSFGYHWDWNLSFTFGAVLSATDPLAVVSLMEETEAPAKLAMLMTGESHLSDLAALVTFKLVLGLATGEATPQPGETTRYTMSMLFGGPAWGLFLGMLTLFAIRRNTSRGRKNDTLIQVTLTVCLAYISFIVSENNFSGNGVLATLTAALMIAAYAWPSFADPENVRHVWEAIEYFAQTIVFLLTGLVFGTIIVEYEDSYIPFSAYAHVILIWALVYVIRFVIMAVLFFPLRKLSMYPLKPSEAIVMAWGGIKGAVAVSLALIVRNSVIVNTLNPLSGDKDGVQFFFFVNGVVFLSGLINMSTVPALMRFSRLLSRTAVQKQLLHFVKSRIKDNANSQFSDITGGRGGGATGLVRDPEEAAEFARVALEDVSKIISAFNANGKFVKRLAMEEVLPADASNSLLPVLGNSFVFSPLSRSHRASPADATTTTVGPGGTSGRMTEEVGGQELLEQVRELFYKTLKSAYWEMIEGGVLPRNSSATRNLLQSCDLAKDYTAQPLCDFQQLNLPTEEENAAELVTDRAFSKINACLPDWITIDDYIGERLHAALRESSVFAASCFIEAHRISQVRIAKYVGEGEEADTPEEVTVIAESQAEIERARAYMEVAKKHDPLIVHLVNTKKVASIILTGCETYTSTMLREGIVDNVTAEELRRIFFQDARHIRQLRESDLVSLDKDKGV